MPTVLTDRQRVYDFLKWEVEPRYCRAAGTIKNIANADLAAGDIVPGTPLKLNGSNWEIALAADKDTVDGFFIDERKSEAIDAGETSVKEYQILARGPALVNKDAIPTLDPDGGALTAGNVQACAVALGIRFLAEPPHAEEQLY